jgi:hypothetical protein
MNRGGDIGGILGPIEIKAAQLERDLIVSNAERSMASQRFSQASDHRAALLDHEKKVRTLVATTKASVDPAPKYAVPEVEALGEVPTGGQELEAYIAKLKQVTQAFDTVSQANNQALHHKEKLTERFHQAQQRGGTGELLVTLENQITDLLDTAPTPMAVLEPLIESYEAAGAQS